MKKVLVAILVLGVIGAGGYGVYHHFFADTSESQGRVSSTSEDAVYVDLVADITGYGTSSGVVERFGGEVEAQATLEVKLDNDRTVDECYVKEGDEVEEGQRLFRYDTQEDEDKLEQNKIDIEKAEGSIEISQKTIAQLEKEKAKASADDQLSYTTQILTEQNDIKQNEYDIKTNELENAKLEEAIANATVTAEMAGIVQKISDSDSSSNPYGSGSSENVYITILAIGDYRIKGTVNEQNYSLISEGMRMIVHSRVDSSLTWYGTISEIKNSSDENDSGDSYYSYSYYGDDSGSSNYTFYVDLENSDGLMLGQHVYMEEDVGQEQQREGLWLGDYYIVQDGDQSYVWLANDSNVIEKREVTLGEYDEEMFEYQILDGLTQEDYIAFPMDTITEGLPVIYNDYSVPSINTGMDGDEYYDGEEIDFDALEYNDEDLEDENWEDEDMDDADEVYFGGDALDEDDVYYDDSGEDDDVYYDNSADDIYSADGDEDKY